MIAYDRKSLAYVTGTGLISNLIAGFTSAVVVELENRSLIVYSYFLPNYLRVFANLLKESNGNYKVLSDYLIKNVTVPQLSRFGADAVNTLIYIVDSSEPDNIMFFSLLKRNKVTLPPTRIMINENNIRYNKKPKTAREHLTNYNILDSGIILNQTESYVVEIDFKGKYTVFGPNEKLEYKKLYTGHMVI